MLQGVGIKKFGKDLLGEIKEDNVSNGAAALAYFLMLSIFPAMIALLTLIPYLPIPNLDQAIMDFLNQALPGEAAKLFEDTVRTVTSQQRGGLFTFSLLLAVWSASAGLYAIMQQLNITYDVKEGRSFFKARGTALLLTVLFGALVITAFALVVFGGVAQDWLADRLGWSSLLTGAFALLRWVVIAFFLLLAFAVIYYLGPDVKQRFRFITPGSVAGVVTLVLASLIFKSYVSNFGNYSKVYGSLGAVIIMMLWLYIAGGVLLLGSEINALVEHYSPDGKRKGEKVPEQKTRHRGAPHLHP